MFAAEYRVRRFEIGTTVADTSGVHLASTEIVLCASRLKPGFSTAFRLALDMERTEGIVPLDDSSAALGLASMILAAISTFLALLETAICFAAMLLANSQRSCDWSAVGAPWHCLDK